MRYHRHTSSDISLEFNIIFVLVFYLLIIAIKLWNQREKNKRDDAIFNKSIKDGYCFIEQSAEIPEIPYHFQVLNSYMHYPTFSSIVMGEQNGINFEIMDFTYRTNGRRSSVILNTLWIISCKDYYNINSFALYSKANDYNTNPFIRVTFPEDKAFSSKFNLYGADEKTLKKLFNQTLREAFLRGNNYEFDFECSRGYFLVAARGANCPDFDYDARMQILERMIIVYRTLLARYK